MTRKEYGCASVALLTDDLSKNPGPVWIESTEWFIQDKQIGTVDERDS